MLDDLDLVHMNGRVYDPLIARFLSGDPLINDPTNGQSYNRYSYVLNNPTNLTDPTGFADEPACGKEGAGCRKDTLTGTNIPGRVPVRYSYSGDAPNLTGGAPTPPLPQRHPLMPNKQ